ncbi:MAG TPA: DUF4491 family protein [Anaerolineae bacterium]|nr:DUF4491 family protein [Anaerolineae bacterium]
MILNWTGFTAACATFFAVWLGHVTVRKVEYRAPDIRQPMIIAALIGLALEVAALSSNNLYLSGACGIVGMTALFDALEFRRQSRRVLKGHAPANPNNPRHAKFLAEGHATTIDLLKREPVGHSSVMLSPEGTKHLS